MKDAVTVTPNLRKLIFIIGAVAKHENNYELVLRWDRDMFVRKLTAKVQEAFWHNFDIKPWVKANRKMFKRDDIRDMQLLRKAFGEFLTLQEQAVREILDEYAAEAGDS